MKRIDLSILHSSSPALLTKRKMPDYVCGWRRKDDEIAPAISIGVIAKQLVRKLQKTQMFIKKTARLSP